MNIYFLCQTPLKFLNGLKVPPSNGDVVCYIRPAQDVEGHVAEDLKKYGVTVIYSQTLLTNETSEKADMGGEQFLKNWFLDDGEDFSDIGNLSLGTSYGYWVGLTLRPRTLVRVATSFKNLLLLYSEAAIIFSDAQNGKGVYETKPSHYPLKTILKKKF